MTAVRLTSLAVTRTEVLTVRRAVNSQRRAGHTETQIARWLTAAKLAPPAGANWRKAGIGPAWSAQGVTRFMECTRHVRSAPAPVTAAPTAASPKLRVKGIKAATIYTAAFDPTIHFP